MHLSLAVFVFFGPSLLTRLCYVTEAEKTVLRGSEESRATFRGAA